MDDQMAAVPSTEPAAEAVASTPATPELAKKRAAWVLPVTIVLALALVGGGYFAWTTMQAQALAKSRAAAAVDAETHWEAAATSLKTISTVTDQLKSMDPGYAKTGMPPLTTSLEEMQTTATKELDAVEKAVAILPAGDAKTAYTAAIQSGRDALKRAAAAVPELKSLPEVYSQSKVVSTSLTAARKSVNAGVSAGNSRKWGSAIAAQNKALKLCDKASAALAKMKKAVSGKGDVADTSDIPAAAKLIKNERGLAEASLAAARGGQAGSGARYNAGVKRYNKAVTAANKAREPLFFDSPIVFATASLDSLRSAVSFVESATSYHEKALRASMAKV